MIAIQKMDRNHVCTFPMKSSLIIDFPLDEHNKDVGMRDENRWLTCCLSSAEFAHTHAIRLQTVEYDWAEV